MTRHLHAVPDRDWVAERAAQLATELAPNAYTIALHAPVTVPCPTCKAQPGGRCESPNGWTPRNGFHVPRMQAVAHLTEQERVTAYVRMKAQQEQDRAEVEAEMARRETDPAYVAQRDATRAAVTAAFNQINADLRAEEREMRARCRDPWIHPQNCHCRTEETDR